jgi:hypothetical protein
VKPGNKESRYGNGKDITVAERNIKKLDKTYLSTCI